ncbi:MAG TPA: c-type cytochrome domain-containing protein [Chloroflexota bacterium]|nr:c-type cytochrome domain-containing protein [Chloroflexota bacterium]
MATSAKPQTPRGLQPPDKKPVRITVPDDRKVRYGDPFFPKVPFQAIFYIGATFAVLIFLALTNPAPLQDPADPLNHAAIDPKPEWYFMFLFQLLKYFSGPFIPIGTVVIPTIVVVLLLLLPFYDRNWARKAVRRPVGVASMSGGMIIVVFLMWGGLGFPKPDFSTTSTVATAPTGGSGGTVAGSISPDVQAIFTAHCAACHLGGNSLGGLNLASYAGIIKGGIIVPGSAIVPGDHKNSVLWKIIQPGSSQPGGNRMPLGGPYLSTAQISTIATWIDSLGTGASGKTAGGGAAAPVSFKNDVSTIFTAHCAACHLNGTSLGGLSLTYAGLQKGGIIVPGPAIKPGDHASSVLWKMIQPGGNWPGGNRMPLGGPYLTTAQITTIATWLDQGAKNN